MNWKRSTCGLLLGGSLCVFNVGCAAFNAIVSSPAGQSAGQGSPERIAAIGRVFENQGKYAQAQNMYRRVLTADPSNSLAKERLNYIATMNSNRSFVPSGSQSAKSSMVAVADSLNARRRTKPRRLGAKPPVDAINSQAETVVASLTDAKPEVALATVPAAIAEVAPVIVDTVESDAGEIVLTNPGWTLDQTVASTVEEAADLALPFVAAPENADISKVAFEGNDTQVATIPSVDTSWKSADRVVTFEQLLEWSEAPHQNTDDLVFALTAGESEGVKAFAATLLAECSEDNSEINAALRNVCKNGSPLLRVSSRDTLMQRGEVTEDGVTDLLSLMSEEDTGIRAQAAASLRNVAGTEWAPRCVAGLQDMLSDGDETLVTVAAATLGDFGTEAVSSRSRLMQILESTDSDETRAAADLALNRIPVPSEFLPPVDDTPSKTDSGPTISADGYLPIVE